MPYWDKYLNKSSLSLLTIPTRWILLERCQSGPGPHSTHCEDQWRSHREVKVGQCTPHSKKKCQKSGKRGGKSKKKRENREKRGKIGKKRQKSGRVVHFAPLDRKGWLRHWSRPRAREKESCTPYLFLALWAQASTSPKHHLYSSDSPMQ